MNRGGVLAACLLLALVVLAPERAETVRGAFTPLEIYNECMSSDNRFGESGCSVKNEYCADLREAVSRQYETIEQCQQACRDAKRAYSWQFQAASTCNSTFQTGSRLCRRQCQALYRDRK
jgi:hypothetical protein